MNGMAIGYILGIVGMTMACIAKSPLPLLATCAIGFIVDMLWDSKSRDEHAE